MYQTTIQHADAVRCGSAKVEIGTTIENLENIGAVRNVAVVEEWENVKITGDNVGTIADRIKNHKMKLTANWLELHLENLKKFRGGLDTITTVAGTTVADYQQTIPANSLAIGQFLPFEKQNHDGTEVMVDSVSDGETPLDEGTDFEVIKCGDRWGIVILSGAVDFEPENDYVITYDYTPAASKRLTSGGRTAISPCVIRLTNTNEDGKRIQITIYKATNSTGLNLTLPADDADDVWTTPLEIQGTCDTSRTVGEQLFEIIDEQCVS